jgi:hypothetical protein
MLRRGRALPGQQVEQSCLFPDRRGGQAIVPLTEQLPHLAAQRREIAEPHLEVGEPLRHQGSDLSARDIAAFPFAQYTRQLGE